MQHTGEIRIRDAIVHTKISLPRFYEARGFQPAWITDEGFGPAVNDAMDRLRSATEEGLEPADYHLNLIEIYREQLSDGTKEKAKRTPAAQAEFDLLLTDAVLLYLSHLLAGSVNPETFDKEWHANRREADLASLLQDALTTGNLQDLVAKVSPRSDGYFRLKNALRSYRSMAEKDDWPSIAPGPKLQKGDSNVRITLLKDRLKATGELNAAENGNETAALFDGATERALKRFQKRHGLDADGIVGPRTLAALNVTVDQRIEQVKLNLERWRWLPQDLGQKYILVNIPDFSLNLLEKENSLLQMRVVVGRSYRRTPVFSDRITYIVINPPWEVPYSIAVKDKLPLIKKDSDYLAKMHMSVFTGWGSEAKKIDPAGINWIALNERHFPYRLRQAPGPWNALGQIKFMFPNKFDVYLHGTPDQELFLKESRSFSSGCIRLETPLELATYLLSSDPKLSRETISKIISENTERTIRLPVPMPVHLLYWTAWISEDGTVNFREDIYGRDNLLANAMEQK